MRDCESVSLNVVEQKKKIVPFRARVERFLINIGKLLSFVSVISAHDCVVLCCVYKQSASLAVY